MTNSCSFKASTGLSASQMLRQGRSCIAPQTVFQLTWCLRKTFLLTHKFGTRLSHRNDCQQRGVVWVTYRCYNSNPYYRSGTSVIRRSSVPPRAWAGPTTNWSQPETVSSSKAATPLLFVVVEHNHSWWWPFKSPTNRKETLISSLCTAAIDASKQ